MAVQFQCPQCGNMLQAEEHQAGQQSACPFCQTVFVIPMPYPAAAAPHASAQPSFTPPQDSFPTIGPSAAGTAKAPARAPAFELREPELLHIPCPQCKETLETPIELLDQDVLCPHCQAQFQLRRRDSIEFKRELERKAQTRETKASRNWLNFAIVAAILVVLFLGGLIAWQIYGTPPAR